MSTSAVALNPNKLQSYVLDWLEGLGGRLHAQGCFRDVQSPRQQNQDWGLRLQAGRQAGHTTLAAQILLEYPQAVVITHDDRREALLKRMLPEEDHIRVIRSRMLDGKKKAQVINQEWLPLVGKKICVVDDASLFSDWEIEPFRCARWDAYIELN